MSGWTIVTLRGREAQDYEYTRSDSTDPWDATSDIVASMDADDRVREWTVMDGHVYAYLNCERYGWTFAEEFLEDYAEMTRDAVVLGANDTSDQGTARYYPRPDLGRWTDQYEETEYRYVGRLALAVINARHGIIARDPFHDDVGLLDGKYLENGSVKADGVGE